MKFVASPVLDTTMPKASQPGGGEASPSRSPLESSRCQRVKIGLRREKCLSVASCFPFPIFTCWRREPRRGYDPVALEQCSNPFFAYFLWRSKESERLPGRPRQTTVDRRKKRFSYRRTDKKEQPKLLFPHTQQQNQSNKLTDTTNHSLPHRSTGDKGMRHLNIVVEPAIAVQARRDLLANLFISRLRAFTQHKVLEQFLRHGQTLRCQ